MKTIVRCLLAGLAAVASHSHAEGTLLFEVGADQRLNWQSFETFRNIDLEEGSISIFGPWLGPDKIALENLIAYFEVATGAKVEYPGSDSFEQQVLIDGTARSPHAALESS